MAQLPTRVVTLRVAGGEKECVGVFPPGHQYPARIPSQAVAGILTRKLAPSEKITSGIFAPNKLFVDFMHQAISLHGISNPTLINEAKRHRAGYVYVVDQRYNHNHVVVPPNELIGAFEVKSGRLIPGSYIPNPQHVLFSTAGLMQLEDDLLENLLEALVNISPSPVEQPVK